jgi:hypothetical protein
VGLIPRCGPCRWLAGDRTYSRAGVSGVGVRGSSSAARLALGVVPWMALPTPVAAWWLPCGGLTVRLEASVLLYP